MSEMKHYKGTVEKIKLDNMSLLEKMHDICSRGVTKWYMKFYKDETSEDMFYEMMAECTNDHTYINGDIYKFTKEELDERCDIFDAKKNKYGEIEYEVKYYNGGCGFEEALETALVRMDNIKG